MRKLFIFCLTAIIVVDSAYSQEKPDKTAVVSAGSQKEPDTFVFVEGGTFKNTKSTNYFGKSVTLSGFYIGKYEVTQKEWTDVMGSNNPSQFKGDNMPVEVVNWYDCVEYCNKRSIKEGLKPYYNIDKNKKDLNIKAPQYGFKEDDIKWTVTINAGANGYRLPTEAEWEYAAIGGQKSKNYTYSGGNDVDKVAWYYQNSGDTHLPVMWTRRMLAGNHDRAHPVGGKEPNELGLYDMTGNVREWCWDLYGDLETNVTDPKGSHTGSARVWRGGGWMSLDYYCETSCRGSYEANLTGPDQGFRVCRGK